MKVRVLAAALTLALSACAAPRRPAPAPTPALSSPAAAPSRAGRFGGASAERLRALLGTPAFTRRDGATEMWRYDGAACRAFFFLENGVVRHIETLPAGRDAPADPACLNALKKA